MGKACRRKQKARSGNSRETKLATILSEIFWKMPLRLIPGGENRALFSTLLLSFSSSPAASACPSKRCLSWQRGRGNWLTGTNIGCPLTYSKPGASVVNAPPERASVSALHSLRHPQCCRRSIPLSVRVCVRVLQQDCRCRAVIAGQDMLGVTKSPGTYRDGCLLRV
jgi:hypothetical protein